MSRASRVLSLVILMASIAGNGFPESGEAEAPELVVTLAPAGGVVPLAGFNRPEVYSFQVWAVDSDHRRMYAKAEAFVRPGQTRTLNETTRDGTRVQGTVTLTDAGVAKYKAELFMQGKRIASSSAKLVLEKR